MPAFLLLSRNADTEIALSLLVIFVSAKLAAELLERCRLPGIAGEILAGIVIGPQVLNWIGPNEVTALLGELGVMFLLFRVGLEVRASEFLAVGPRAALIAVAGVIVPFLSGWGLARAWGLAGIEPVFLGAAMVATSVGITAQVLSSGGWINQGASRMILAAAVIDDVLGLLVLAAVSSTAKGEINYVDLSLTALLAGGFTVFIAVFGTRAAKKLVPRMNQGMRLVEAEYALSLGLLFALALLATYAGVAAIVGAFLAGMALSETVDHRVHRMTDGVTELLVPFFLAGIGLKLDLAAFGGWSSALFALVIVVAAALSKFVACGVAALGAGRTDAIRVGLGMIPRGEVGMVVAQMGLAFGAVSQPVYGTIVFMSVATTLIAPPLLRMAFRGAAAGERVEGVRLG